MLKVVVEVYFAGWTLVVELFVDLITCGNM